MFFAVTSLNAGCFLFFCSPHYTHHHHIHHSRFHHYHYRPRVVVKRIEKTIEKQVIVKTPPAPAPAPADTVDRSPISPLK